MKSEVHAQLIADLGHMVSPSWGERALLSTLVTLAGLMELADRVEILKAWVDADDTVRIEYIAPWREESPVGLVRVRREEPLPYYLYDDEAHQTPEEYGTSIAILDIHSPLGSVASRLVYDSRGVGWWGDGYTD